MKSQHKTQFGLFFFLPHCLFSLLLSPHWITGAYPRASFGSNQPLLPFAKVWFGDPQIPVRGGARGPGAIPGSWPTCFLPCRAAGSNNYPTILHVARQVEECSSITSTQVIYCYEQSYQGPGWAHFGPTPTLWNQGFIRNLPTIAVPPPKTPSLVSLFNLIVQTILDDDVVRVTVHKGGGNWFHFIFLAICLPNARETLSPF